MVLGVQYVVLDACLCEDLGKVLGLINVYRTYEYGLTVVMSLDNSLKDCSILTLLSLEYRIVFIDTCDGLICRESACGW